MQLKWLISAQLHHLMPYLGAMDANYKPYIAAVIIQLTYTGYFVISKAAFDEGLSTFVFIFYRQAAASVLLAPLAFVFERNSSPPLTFMVSLKLFMHAMLGITLSLNLYNIGVKYTSASVASATANSVPVYTFFFAVLFRMETMKVKRISGIAKAVGIALCVAGVVMTALYRGSYIHPLNLHGSSGRHTSPTHQKAALPKTTWIKGTLFMITSNITWALWLVLQGMLLKEYTSKLLFTTLECLFGTFQSLFVAIAFERDSSKWKLQWDMGLLAILYSGFVVTGVCFYLQTFCVEKKGPVFSAIFTPLNIVFTMICSSVFLGEMISVGRCGAYAYLYFRWTSYGWRPLWSTMGKEQGKSSLSGLNRRRKASTCRRRKQHGLNYFDVISTSKHERNPCVEEIKSWKCYQMKSAAKF